MVWFSIVFMLHAVTAASNEECVNRMNENADNLASCLQMHTVDTVCGAPGSQVIIIAAKLHECFKKPEDAPQVLQTCLTEVQNYATAVQTCYTNATSQCKPKVQTLSSDVKACLQKDNKCVNDALTKQVEVIQCLSIDAAKAVCHLELDTLPNTVGKCLTDATNQPNNGQRAEALLQCSSDLYRLTQGVQTCFTLALESCRTKVKTLTKEVEACLSNPHETKEIADNTHETKEIADNTHETKETTDKGQRLILGSIISINVLSVVIRPFLYL